MATTFVTFRRPLSQSLTSVVSLSFIIVIIICSSFGAQAQLSENIVEYDVIEEQPSSTLVGNIVTDAGLDQRFGDQTLKLFTYDFLTPTNIFNNYFVIEKTGLLRTSRTIDRDQLCSRMMQCDIQLDIAVKPVEHFQIIKVRIHVIDINDNWPVFQEDRITLSISETTMPNATFAMPTAEDPDSALYGVQSYQLQNRPGSEKFALQVTHSAETGESPTDVHLVLKEKLDREESDFYGLVLMVYDGGMPRKSGSIMVDIEVVDANDNAPKFMNQTYEVYVFENVAVDTTIIQVHAEDKDIGQNGQVIYSFSRSTQTEYGDLFDINKVSGEVLVKNALDYEQGGEYVLGLVAQDQGSNALSAYAKLKIHVKDVNDHAPRITVNSLTSTGGVEISESAELHMFVAHISVMDPDSGRNGEFTCTIDDNHFALDPLYKREYKIITNAKFDRERQEVYNVNVICQDRGTQPRTAIEPIVITILDINDHVPRFPQDVYYVTFQENNTLNDVIIQVNATDKDIGPNAEIEYSITNLGSYPDSLKIDPKTGTVRAGIVFDHEAAARYEYVVLASDKGDPAFTATATLSVSVSDINDNAPVFERPFYKFGTFENQAAGTEIGRVLAHDKDGPNFNEISYILDYEKGDARGKGAEVFAIDLWTGKITTKRVLDHEGKNSYTIVVIARNFGYPLSTAVNVTIDVADKNDNAPIIIYPIDETETIQIASSAEVGSVVTHIEAYDRDLGVNAFLKYEIESGNSNNLFDINPIDGTILVSRDLHEFADYYFNLRVLVSDQGSPSMSVVTQLHIYVNGTAAAQKGPGGTAAIDDEMLVFIVATLFGLVLVIGLIFIILLLLRRRRRQRELKYSGAPQNTKAYMAPATNGSPMRTVVAEPEVTGSLRSGSLPKKEVKFSARDDEVIQNRFFDNGSWPTGIADHEFMQNPRAHSTTLGGHSPRGSSPCHLASDAQYPTEGQSQGSYPLKELPPPFRDGARHRLYYCDGQQNGSKPVAELQAQDLLELLPAPPGAGDGGSDRGSLTDSGRGPSEEGDHLQHSPSGDSNILPPQGRPISPKAAPQKGNQPTKFTVYPCSPSRRLGLNKSSPIPNHCANNSMPHSHNNQQSPWKQHSYGDIRSPSDNNSPQKPMVPPRTSSINSINNSRPPALPPKGPRLQTFSVPEPAPRRQHQCSDIEEQLRRSAESRNRNSMDCMSDDATTTSGSYVVDLADVEEEEHDACVSRDVVV